MNGSVTNYDIIGIENLGKTTISFSLTVMYIDCSKKATIGTLADAECTKRSP